MLRRLGISHREDQAVTWAFVGGAFLALNVSLVAVPVASLALGLQIGGWMVPVSLVLWLAGLLMAADRSSGIGRFAIAVVVVGVVALVGVVVALNQFDFSFDGRTYHKGAVFALSDGWNPFAGVEVRASQDVWVRHYPKSFEMAASALYRLVGRVEVGKALHVLPLGASFFLTLSLLVRFKIPSYASLLASTLAALNPVWIVQSLTFYVDGDTAALLLAAIASALSLVIFRTTWLHGLALGGSILLLINLKATGLFYGGLILLAAAIVFLIQRRFGELRRLVVVQGAALVAAVFLLGFHPYVHNALDAGNPFYPIMGEGSAAFDRSFTPNIPPNLRGAPRLEQLAYGVFGKPSAGFEADAVLVLPFTPIIGSGEAYVFDTRIAGLGPLFGGSLLVAGGVVIWLARSGVGGVRRPVILTVLFILATVVAHPAGWWARYAPQLWLVPVIVLVGAYAARSRSGRWQGALLASLLAINVGFVAVNNLGSNVVDTRATRAAYEPFRSNGVVMSVNLTPEFRDATLTQMGEAGVIVQEYESVGDLPCEGPEALPGSAGVYCAIVP